MRPGSGTDTATVSNSTVGGLFFANLDGGTNAFTSSNSDYLSSVSVNTMPGNHDVDFLGGTINGSTFINAFNGTSDIFVTGITAASIFVVRTATAADVVNIEQSSFSDVLKSAPMQIMTW